MDFLKHLAIFSMLATAGIPATEVYIPEPQVIEADPLQAEVITEVAEEAPKEEPVKKDQNKQEVPEPEEEASEEPCTIDNEKIELCDHTYTRVHGTGGEEGDVWEYICDLCGDTYFEPYDEPDETMLEIDEDPDNTEPAGENTNDETEE